MLHQPPHLLGRSLVLSGISQDMSPTVVVGQKCAWLKKGRDLFVDMSLSFHVSYNFTEKDGNVPIKVTLHKSKVVNPEGLVARSRSERLG